MSFLVPYNSQIIKSRISRFVILSWTPHLPILLIISERSKLNDNTYPYWLKENG